MKAIVTVVGRDRVGIVANVAALLAEHNINILDISQTIMDEYFTMMMLVDTSGCALPFADIAAVFEREGESRGLSIRVQREDLFNAMREV